MTIDKKSLICFSTMGLLVGFQYMYAIKEDLNGVNKNSFLIYFTSISIVLFIIWILVITDGFEKQNWRMDLLPIASIIVGFYLPTKTLFSKRK